MGYSQKCRFDWQFSEMPPLRIIIGNAGCMDDYQKCRLTGWLSEMEALRVVIRNTGLRVDLSQTILRVIQPPDLLMKPGTVIPDAVGPTVSRYLQAN